MKANLDIGNILFLARAFGAHRNLAISTVSLYSARSGRLFVNYKEKQDTGQTAVITNVRRDEILQWFSDNWPNDLDWPADIPRPKPSKTRAA